jgi:hypothetical protein
MRQFMQNGSVLPAGLPYPEISGYGRPLLLPEMLKENQSSIRDRGLAYRGPCPATWNNAGKRLRRIASGASNHRREIA